MGGTFYDENGAAVEGASQIPSAVNNGLSGEHMEDMDCGMWQSKGLVAQPCL